MLAPPARLGDLRLGRSLGELSGNSLDVPSGFALARAGDLAKGEFFVGRRRRSLTVLRRWPHSILPRFSFGASFWMSRQVLDSEIIILICATLAAASMG